MLHGNVCILIVLPCYLPGMLPSTQELSERCLARLVPGKVWNVIALHSLVKEHTQLPSVVLTPVLETPSKTLHLVS
jgi:hypothetical protein